MNNHYTLLNCNNKNIEDNIYSDLNPINNIKSNNNKLY